MGLLMLTGGSAGLGAALCDEYIGRGWEVIEFSRSAPHPFSVKLDLADSAGAASVFADALRELSAHAIDEVVAINNAATLGPVGPVERSPVAAISSHLDTNILSGILFARAFIGAFQDHSCPKSFVNVSSGAAVREHAGWSLYCASKAAMNSFVRTVALEQTARAHPICTYSVNPGVMDTGMQAAVRAPTREEFPDVDRYIGLKRDGALPPSAVVAVRLADLIASRPQPGSFRSLS